MKMQSPRDKLTTSKILVNAWLAIPNSWTAEVISSLGFDSVTIDMQHGLIDYQLSVSMLQTISSTSAIPIVRVPWNDPAIIMKELDAGALGIICPMINSKEEAQQFVGACMYPPLGFRSYGPLRAIQIYGSNYFDDANPNIAPFAMIETKEGLDNLDDILSVEGLEGVYIGTMDLSISLGIKKRGNLKEPRLHAAISDIVSKTKARGLLTGIHSITPADLPLLKEWGFDIITPINDSKLLISKASEELQNTRKSLNLSE